MKRFFGSLLIVLGVAATLSLIMPQVREPRVPQIRWHQAASGLILLAFGYALFRNPRHNI